MIKKMKSKYLVLVLFLLSFCIVLFVSYWANEQTRYSLRTMEYNIEKRLDVVAEWLAELTGIEELDMYRNVEDMELPSYNDLRLRLLEFTERTGVLYAYYLRHEGDYLYYIIDNDFNEATRVGVDSEPFNLNDEPWIKHAIEGRTVHAGLGNYSIGWDGLLTSYAPVFRRDGTVGAIAGIDVIDTSIVTAMKMVRILTILQLLMVCAVFASGLFCFAHFRKEAIAAKKASLTKSNFLANMSHEIRNPMNAITGMSELLLRRELSEDARDDVQDIKQASTNLISIINDILDFSKIEAGMLEIIPVKYTLSSLINDTVNIIHIRLMEKPIEFKTNIDSNIPNNLLGDVVRLRQIMLNLLSNAIKFTEEGNVSLAIGTEKQDDTKIWLRIEISDTGSGIKPEDKEKLFSSFMRVDTKRNRNIEGTGLGLAITKQLCIAMDGDISMESEYGKGSKFTVIIPQGFDRGASFSLVGDLNSRQDYLNSAYINNAIRFTIPAARILIVDDLPTNLKVAEGLLAPYKASVDTCLGGAEAIELIKSSNYDLVFMDHIMQEMDGIEACAAIRAWEKEQGNKGVEFPSGQGSAKTPKLQSKRPQGVPIVALTANAISGMREMFLEKGFNDFLAKPIDVSKLDEILKKWVAKEKREIRNEKLAMSNDKKLVLLVDDNRENLKLGMSALEEKYNVITAPSAEKMQKLLESSSPALILLNSNMPKPVNNDIPVILVEQPFDPEIVLKEIADEI